MGLSVEEQILAAQEARTAGDPIVISHPGADLSGFQLPAGDLVGANFQDADLTGAILAGAHLARANLKGAILVGASLDGADLSDADLRGADLAGARIDDAVLAGARLEAACLQAVSGDPLSMVGARMDQATIENSDFTMRDIAQMVIRGVEVREHETTPVSTATPHQSDEQESAPPSSAMPRMVGPSGAPSILPLVVQSAAPPRRERLRHDATGPEPSLGAAAQEALASDDPVSSKRVVDLMSPEGSELPRSVPSFDDPLRGMPGLDQILKSLPPLALPREIEGSTTTDAEAPISSIVPGAQADEISAREELADANEDVPVSQRMFMQLNALIDDARIEAAPPLSLRPQRKSIKMLERSGFSFPSPGDEYLGVTIQQEFSPGTTSRCFRGVTKDGEKRVVRIFDPHCEGAALQLPAFQRGLRALNRLQGIDDPDLLVVELTAVAADQTAYVLRDYPGASLTEMLEVSVSLEQGLQAISSLAKTMAAIHGQGIMVRSWKPSNVLVEGFQLILSEPDMVHLPTLTQARGDSGGYEAYAAPEELVGRGTRSPTADVYSLGKMLEFLLTGQEPLVPLGSPPLISQRENIPKTLVEIVKRATSAQPADRYQQVGDFLADLENFQEHGDRATLAASIRPDGVSRLDVPLLTSNPRVKDPKQIVEERQRHREEKDEDEETEIDWVRQVEVGLALVAGMGGLALLTPLVLSPRSVEQMDSLSIYLAGAVATLVLALPGPEERRVLFRLATWVAATTFVWFLDPLLLSRYSWESHLRSGDEYQKVEAVRALSQLGEKTMHKVFLNGAQLGESRLDLVDFSGSSLKAVNFRGAFLVDAKFDGADVSGANFRSANLSGASFSEAIGVAEARCDSHTFLPRDLQCVDGHLSREGEERSPKSEPLAQRPEAANQKEGSEGSPNPEKKSGSTDDEIKAP